MALLRKTKLAPKQTWTRMRRYTTTVLAPLNVGAKDSTLRTEAHRLNCSAAEDILIVKDDAHPDWMWHMEVSEVDGRYLILSVTQDTARVCAHAKSAYCSLISVLCWSARKISCGSRTLRRTRLDRASNGTNSSTSSMQSLASASAYLEVQ